MIICYIVKTRGWNRNYWVKKRTLCSALANHGVKNILHSALKNSGLNNRLHFTIRNVHFNFGKYHRNIYRCFRDRWQSGKPWALNIAYLKEEETVSSFPFITLNKKQINLSCK